MLIKSRPAWMLPESAATPESIFRDRRPEHYGKLLTLDGSGA